MINNIMHNLGDSLYAIPFRPTFVKTATTRRGKTAKKDGMIPSFSITSRAGLNILRIPKYK